MKRIFRWRKAGSYRWRRYKVRRNSLLRTHMKKRDGRLVHKDAGEESKQPII